jgi:hypothetical protein
MQRCKVGVEPNAALRVGGEGETSDSLTPSPAQAGLFSEFLPRAKRQTDDLDRARRTGQAREWCQWLKKELR